MNGPTAAASVAPTLIRHCRLRTFRGHLLAVPRFGSALTAVGCFQLLVGRPGTHSQRDPTSSTDCFRRLLKTYTCSRVTSASSALGVLNDYPLYKSTHSRTHSLTHCVCLRVGDDREHCKTAEQIEIGGADLPTESGRSWGNIRYDTIRHAILTCARKSTRVGLIYRTEPTTKKSKNRKTKSKNRYAQK